jgi:hypothetical protein
LLEADIDNLSEATALATDKEEQASLRNMSVAAAKPTIHKIAVRR